MLIFTRRDGQSFQIGNNVTVRILNTSRGQIRIGVDAPKSIAVHRTEVAERIRAENGGVIPGREAQ